MTHVLKVVGGGYIMRGQGGRANTTANPLAAHGYKHETRAVVIAGLYACKHPERAFEVWDLEGGRLVGTARGREFVKP